MSFEFYGFGYLPLELSKHKIPFWIEKKYIGYIFGDNVDLKKNSKHPDDFHGI